MTVGQLKGSKEQLLAEFHPVVENPDKQVNAAKGSTLPPWRVISPKPGDHADPKADDFAIIDGIARARKLWKGERREEARQSLHRRGVTHTPRMPDALGDVSRFLSLKILCALQEGRHDEALATIRHYLQIDPYRTEPITAVRRGLPADSLP